MTIIDEGVLRIACETFDIGFAQIGPDTRLAELDASEDDRVIFAANIEAMFGVELSDDDVLGALTLGDFAEAVARALEKERKVA